MTVASPMARTLACRSARTPNRRTGFTLVEVLLTALILGVGLTVLLSCLSTCLRTMALARDYEQVGWTFSLGGLTYPDPLDPSTDVKKDYTVEPDSSLVDGFVFSRTVDEKDDEAVAKDPLFVVRTRVTWGEGGDTEKAHEEIVRYVWQRGK